MVGSDHLSVVASGRPGEAQFGEIQGAEGWGSMFGEIRGCVGAAGSLWGDEGGLPCDQGFLQLQIYFLN